MLRRFRCYEENASKTIDLKFCTVVAKHILNRSANYEQDRVHGVRIITKKAKRTLQTCGVDFKKKKKKKKACVVCEEKIFEGLHCLSLFLEC